MNASMIRRTLLHKADSRGLSDHGWLNAWHSFRFANWHDPERMHFGALRVLNYDTTAAGKGFHTHPHDNMEIITIVTEGTLKHTDSMGNEGIINAGDLHVMSTGTGCTIANSIPIQSAAPSSRKYGSSLASAEPRRARTRSRWTLKIG